MVSHRSEFKDRLARPVSQLLDKMSSSSNSAGSSQQASTSQVTFLPSYGHTVDDDDPMDELLYGSQRYVEKAKTETPSQDQAAATDQGQRFRGSTLSYILDGPRFLEHKGTHGLADVTMQTALDEDNPESDQENDSESEGATQADSPTIKSTPEMKYTLQKPRDVLRSAIQKGLKWGLEDFPDENSRIGQLAQRISQTQDKYVFYSRGQKMFHKSYEWLLSICSKLLKTKPETLHQMVWLLECILIVGVKQLDMSSKQFVGRETEQFFASSKKSYSSSSFINDDDEDDDDEDEGEEVSFT